MPDATIERVPITVARFVWGVARDHRHPLFKGFPKTFEREGRPIYRQGQTEKVPSFHCGVARSAGRSPELCPSAQAGASISFLRSSRCVSIVKPQARSDLARYYFSWPSPSAAFASDRSANFATGSCQL